MVSLAETTKIPILGIRRISQSGAVFGDLNHIVIKAEGWRLPAIPEKLGVRSDGERLIRKCQKKTNGHDRMLLICVSIHTYETDILGYFWAQKGHQSLIIQS